MNGGVAGRKQEDSLRLARGEPQSCSSSDNNGKHLTLSKADWSPLPRYTFHGILYLTRTFAPSLVST